MNPADQENCLSCKAPLSASAFDAPAESGEGLPDWLSSLQGAGDLEEGLPSEETPAPPFEPGFDLGEVQIPDWLSTGTAPEEPTAEPAEGGLPEWLSGISGVEEANAPESAVPEGEAEADWLSSLLQDQPPETPTAAEPPDWLKSDEKTPSPFVGEGPDWLSQPEAEEAPAQPAFAGEIPDWLSSLAGEESAEQPPAAEVPAAFEIPPVQEPEVESSGQPSVPDWPAAEPEASSEQPASGASAFILDEQETASSEVPTPSGDFLTGLPDWVSQVGADQGDVDDSAGEGAQGLVQGELPTWLEAMRPVEAAAPVTPYEDVSGADVVAAGPLAGLRGVLAAEPDALQPHKPTAYSIKLRVTDEQRARVALLEELLATEDKPKPLPATPLITTQFVLRLVIALALILPILWLLLADSQLFKPPQPAEMPGVTDLHNQIAALPIGSPVLVAFDYEPAFAGEMEAAASAVLVHLTERRANLLLVSTSPTGPVLAQGLLAKLNQQPEGTKEPYRNYANLGYLPGGVIGLLGLAANPAQVLPYTLEGLYVWDQSALQGINTAADFSLLLVLTDNPETARSWIEQVGPTLQEKATPLLLATSAQAGPMVYPYYAARQVQGLLSGLAGGTAYETVHAAGGPASGMWDAFGASILVSSLVILLAGLGSALRKSVVVENKLSTENEKKEQP
ncbi:MAG: hypothetical protein JW726_00075 [Anaerolineales bacterium]|nr:hypothetical protein [Anaerolineales bacterium]